MEDDIVIKVDNVSKKFSRNLRRSMAYGSIDLLRSFVGIPNKTGNLRRGEFWALQDINFELKKGEILGVIGLNGSGKSTLLRVLTGIFPPDKGKIHVRGKIGALIAVGAGFHPHFTGRENIYLNGAVLGLSREQIDERFEDIVRFADIGDFLDAPLATYSSGMRVRLGFAVAIHSVPETLLIDEILSVGDLAFRNKSLRYMAEFRNKAKAIIFVSHNIEQVRTLCTKVIVMDKGQIIYSGDTNKGIALYEELSRKIRTDTIESEAVTEDAIIRNSAGEELGTLLKGSDDLQVTSTEIVNSENHSIEKVGEKEPLIIKVGFKVNKELEGLYFSVSVHSDEPSKQNCIWVMSNDNNKVDFSHIKPGEYNLKVIIKEHHLAPGVYYPTVAIRNDYTSETYEKFKSNVAFRVGSERGDFERGVINVDEVWQLEKA